MNKKDIKFDNIDDLCTHIDSLKIHLGKELANKIDGMEEKYMGRGLAIGVAVGVAAFDFAQYFTGFLTEEGKMSPYIPATFFGTVAGANVGAALGRVYASHKVRQLKKQYPDLADHIKNYDLAKRALTGISVKAGI